ncbi:MAG: Nif3-like dinuclear metal center hexameric protein [Clostridiales bacterium]|nr:Nif3-like dinuclear metal center hexameric protein [Clostridiales bacterium]MCF8023112.1 Nif3-like dinuclear metal center hexameric protein [Clostridiales bacterium]
MKIKEIYELLVQKGIENDPRGKEQVEKIMVKEKNKYEELKEDEKAEFDFDRFLNPYADTRVLNGDLDSEVKKILVGIDMETGEVLLADRLKEKGQAIDMVMSHHPEGKGLVSLYDVMHLQEDLLAKYGIPINVAEGMMSSRISEVKRGLMPLNHNRAVDAARMLDIPFMCCHTPADNHVSTYLQNLVDNEQPESIGDIIKLLKAIPEYKKAISYNAGPSVVVGSNERSAGKVYVDVTGGTSGSEDAYAKMVEAGIGTLIVMHMGEKHRKEAEKNHINVINAGHMSSDSLGMNLMLDEIEKQGVEIVPISGFLRYSRN